MPALTFCNAGAQHFLKTRLLEDMLNFEMRTHFYSVYSMFKV